MAVGHDGQTLAAPATPFTAADPGFTGESRDAPPTGYAAPVAWSYQTFPNEAPILWERAWYKAKSTTAIATHSIIGNGVARVSGHVQAQTVKAAPIVNAGVITGTVRVVGNTTPMPGRSATATGAIQLTATAKGGNVHQLFGQSQIVLTGVASASIGGVKEGAATPGAIIVTGAADAFPAVSAHPAPGVIEVTGTVGEPSITTGATASGTIKLTGQAAGARGVGAITATGAARRIVVTGTAKAQTAPVTPVNPGAIKVTATATATLVKGGYAPVKPIIVSGTAKARVAYEASASGQVRVSAWNAWGLEPLSAQITLTATASAKAERRLSVTGLIRVQVVSARVIKSGEPSADGIIRLSASAHLSDVLETGATPGPIRLTGTAKASTAPTASYVLAPIVITGHVSALVGAPGGTGAAAIDVGATGEGTYVHEATGASDIELIATGDAQLARTGSGEALIELGAAGEGARTLEATGEARVAIEVTGDGAQVHDGQGTGGIELTATGDGGQLLYSDESLTFIDLHAWGEARSGPGILADGTASIELTGSGEATLPHVGLGDARIELSATGASERGTGGQGAAIILFEAVGAGEPQPAQIAWGYGDAYIEVEARGDAAFTWTEPGSRALINLGAAGRGALTHRIYEREGNARIDLRAYGTSLAVHFIREHRVHHRVDKLRMNYSVTKSAVIRTSARDITLIHSASDQEARVRVSEAI